MVPALKVSRNSRNRWATPVFVVLFAVHLVLVTWAAPTRKEVLAAMKTARPVAAQQWSAAQQEVLASMEAYAAAWEGGNQEEIVSFLHPNAFPPLAQGRGSVRRSDW